MNFFFYFDERELDPNSDEDTDDEEDPFVGKTKYVLSENWDFVVDLKWRHGDLKVTTYFKCKPHEYKAFDLNTKQWAKLLYFHKKINNEVNALVNKSRPVNFRVYIGGYCYVSVKDDWDYVQIFECLPKWLKLFAKDMCPACSNDPDHEGVSINFNKWRRLLELIPTIHEEYPEMAKELLTLKWGA